MYKYRYVGYLYMYALHMFLLLFVNIQFTPSHIATNKVDLIPYKADLINM